jgi:hypothetical protein
MSIINKSLCKNITQTNRRHRCNTREFAEAFIGFVQKKKRRYKGKKFYNKQMGTLRQIPAAIKAKLRQTRNSSSISLWGLFSDLSSFRPIAVRTFLAKRDVNGKDAPARSKRAIFAWPAEPRRVNEQRYTYTA